MRTIIGVLCAVALALSLAISLAAQQSKSPAPKSAGASAASHSAAKDLESTIRQAWAAFKDKKKDAYVAGMAEGATEVWTDGKGAHDKAAVLKEMDNISLKSYSLADFKVTPIGPDAALITYRAKVEGTNSGQDFKSDMDVTEVRVKRGGQWKELRYHESEIK
jgi:Domain of unknown function (DUF4440)